HHVRRKRRHGRVARPRQTHHPARSALALSNDVLWTPLPRRSVDRLEPACRPTRLLPLQSIEPLLLPHHLHARHSPVLRHRRAHCLARRPLRVAAARNPPDPCRLHRMVLARHGTTLALPLRPAGFLPIATSMKRLLASALTSSSTAHAQGCAQCRDNAAGTPPATQRAYRNAIILLTLSASGLF